MVARGMSFLIVLLSMALGFMGPVGMKQAMSYE